MACVWHSSLQVIGSIPSLTQPKKAHQGGNAQVESYLNDPQKGTVWGIYRSRSEGTTACEDEPVRPRVSVSEIDHTLFPGPSKRDWDNPPC